MTIRWEEPPTARTYGWAEIARALQARPRQWAVVATCRNIHTAHVTASRMAASQYKPLRGLKFEATARTVDGEHRVYARFMEATS